MLYLVKKRKIYHVIVTPIVFTLIIPLVVLDLWAEIYHRICFPLYKIPIIKRKDYIKIDRHKLEYLNFYQKIYCVYCGYTNGLIMYWQKIAGETEKYWCGIKHKAEHNFSEPPHHKNFVDYGNKEDFENRYKSKPKNK